MVGILLVYEISKLIVYKTAVQLSVIT